MTTRWCRWRVFPTARGSRTRAATATRCSRHRRHDRRQRAVAVRSATATSSPTTCTARRPGISVNDHELFVPDVALGRLVETPEDISGSIDDVPHEQRRARPHRRPSSALVTGCRLHDRRRAGRRVGIDGERPHERRLLVDQQLVDRAPDLTGKLLPTSGRRRPAVVELQRPLRPDAPAQRATGTASSEQQVLADPANAGKLAAAPALQHGLSLGPVGRRHLDRRPARLAAGDHRAAGRAVCMPGNTGFGYGDDTSVALGERLVGLYAKALDGKVERRPRPDDREAAVRGVDRGAQPVRREGAAGIGVLRPPDLQPRRLRPAVHAARPRRALGRRAGLRRVTIGGTDPRTGCRSRPSTCR